ncbi:MAG: hypothetical protein WCK34_00550 [Bacteroidota bacterium]
MKTTTESIKVSAAEKIVNIMLGDAENYRKALLSAKDIYFSAMSS